MKTFTLRLTDLESEALERLAILYKTSQNSLLRDLITGRYLDVDSEATFFDGELDHIADIASFPQAVLDAYEESIDNETYRVNDLMPYRAAQYVLDQEEFKSKEEKELEELFDLFDYVKSLPNEA